MNESPWRVAILEDHAPTRRYFEQCVAGDSRLLLVASFGKLADAIAWFDQHEADVLLTDLGLPDGHGLDLIRRLRPRQPECDVLVISVFGDEDSVLACVEAGAVGYIQKDSQPEDVAQVIVDIRHGASPISPMIARRLLERMRKPEAQPAPQSEITLTASESQVLELIARGYAYAEIARLRGISVSTVQTHVKHLYAKLAVHSRSEAVFEATQLGLIESLRAP